MRAQISINSSLDQQKNSFEEIINSKQSPIKKKINKQEKKIKQTEIKFSFLGEDKIQQATKLIVSSFIVLNTMWKKMGANFNDAYDIYKERMKNCVKIGWVPMMFSEETGQIIAVSLGIDLIDYMNEKNVHKKSEFMNKLGKYGHQLEDQYFNNLLINCKKGQYLYNYGAAIDLSFANNRISKKFWFLGILNSKIMGFKTYFTRSSNRIITRVLGTFGAQIIKKIQITEPGISNQHMELLRIDLQILDSMTLTQVLSEKDPQIDDLQ